MNVTQMTNYFKTMEQIYAQLNRARIIKYAFGAAFFTLISAIFIGMLDFSAAPVCSVMLYVLFGLLVLCTVIALCIQYAFKRGVFAFTTLSMLLSLIFLVDSAAFCEMAGIELYGIAFAVPALLAVWSMYAMRPTLPQKGRKKGSAAVWVVPAITVSGSGFWLGRALHPAFAQMEQHTLHVILAIGFFLLSCALSLCAFGVVHLHYISVLERKGVRL